jgi:hypothetical protein
MPNASLPRSAAGGRDQGPAQQPGSSGARAGAVAARDGRLRSAGGSPRAPVTRNMRGKGEEEPGSGAGPCYAVAVVDRRYPWLYRVAGQGGDGDLDGACGRCRLIPPAAAVVVSATRSSRSPGNPLAAYMSRVSCRSASGAATVSFSGTGGGVSHPARRARGMSVSKQWFLVANGCGAGDLCPCLEWELND